MPITTTFFQRGNVVQTKQFITEFSPKYNVVNILSMISMKRIGHSYYYLLKGQHGSNQAVHISIFVLRSLISCLLNLNVAMAKKARIWVIFENFGKILTEHVLKEARNLILFNPCYLEFSHLICARAGD